MNDDRNIRISVRNLVEFVLRAGDLDNRRSAGNQREAMLAGSRIHRKIQKQMGSGYQAEVSMKHCVEAEEFELHIEGRADGILIEDGHVTIDEIKGVYMDIDRLEGPVEVHMAQAMCYGHFYCCGNDVDQLTIQVTYCNMETEAVRRFQVEKTKEILAEWFQGLVHEYLKWARYLCNNRQRRRESIKDLPFPYPYREGQRDLAVSVYRSISRGRRLFIQAPTGIGKTLSTVYPALKAIGEGHGDKLFYLTAKTITRSVAEESLEILRNQGLYFKSVTITAKEKLCFQEQTECNPDACPYAKGHLDRVNDAVYDIIHLEFGITREIILEYARKHQVCPFEFCLDISNWVDAIICDYNYVFDPNVKLKRYFAGEGRDGGYLFLVDEAHNLVGRAREMYSSVLFKEDFLAVKKLVKNRSGKLAGYLDKSNKELLEMKRECDSYRVLEQVNHLASGIMSLFTVLEEFMEEHPEFPDRQQVVDFYFALRDFLYVFERLDSHYRIYTEHMQDGRFMLRLLCIDPSVNLKECLDMAVSTVFFSATLLPIQYYKALLTGDQEDYAIYAHSPFDSANCLLLIGSDVSSRYTRRNRAEYEKVANYIRLAAKSRPGNYLVFLPSYQYLRQVEQVLEEGAEEDGCEFLSQSVNMREQQKEEFLERFAVSYEDGKFRKSLVGLCVMGGIFSEGIDLKEEQLIGAVIVGTGLPMVCTEQEILKQYFDENGENGFDYAYQYPGMNKVLQSAGRVIRTAEDKGIILLLDDRFLRRDYEGLYPREWSDRKSVTLQNVSSSLEEFWDRASKEMD